MNYIIALASLPGWAYPLILLAVFGVIALGVFLLRKYAKPFKNTEKPKTDKEIAQEEVDRLTQELDEEEYEQAKERKARKSGKPTEEEAREEELARMTRPIEDEAIAKEMEAFDKAKKEDK